MQELCQRCLRILRVEFENLEKDIAAMVQDHMRRKQSGEITNYVYMGNTAVLASMRANVKGLLEYLDSADGTGYPGMDEMIDALDRVFREKTRDGGFPKAGYVIAKRKLDDVARYVVHGSAGP